MNRGKELSQSIIIDNDRGRIPDHIFVDAEILQTPSLIRDWGAAATIDEIRHEQKALFDGLFASLELKTKLIEFDNYKLIVSADIQGSNSDFPVISINRANVALGTVTDWSKLRRELRQAFWLCEPCEVRFFHSSHLVLMAPTKSIDNHLMAAPARLIFETQRSNASHHIILKRSVDLDFYSKYKAIYEATYVERPVLRHEVRTETLESLSYCLTDGLLFEIIINGRWAGIIAAKFRTLVGISGVYMVEIVLDHEARGKNLGPIVHQLFAKAVMEVKPKALIFGTISAKNPWSLQAARRAGRVEVGAWYWVKL